MTKPINTTDDHLALEGYDAVSYAGSGPIKGLNSITEMHNGATYRFANEENRRAFASDPSGFLPKYGGFCATAMSEGTLFSVDPTNYKRSNGELFLFYKGDAGDTLPEWNADEVNRYASAEKHWSADTYKAHA